MGLYDTIVLDVNCYRCGKSRMECQTKDFPDKICRWFEVGEDTGHKEVSEVEAIVLCPKCKNYFFINIFLDNGIITPRYELLDTKD